jgi:hypothetical protein
MRYHYKFVGVVKLKRPTLPSADIDLEELVTLMGMQNGATLVNNLVVP